MCLLQQHSSAAMLIFHHTSSLSHLYKCGRGAMAVAGKYPHATDTYLLHCLSETIVVSQSPARCGRRAVAVAGQTPHASAATSTHLLHCLSEAIVPAVTRALRQGNCGSSWGTLAWTAPSGTTSSIRRGARSRWTCWSSSGAAPGCCHQASPVTTSQGQGCACQ